MPMLQRGILPFMVPSVGPATHSLATDPDDLALNTAPSRGGLRVERLLDATGLMLDSSGIGALAVGDETPVSLAATGEMLESGGQGALSNDVLMAGAATMLDSSGIGALFPTRILAGAGELLESSGFAKLLAPANLSATGELLESSGAAALEVEASFVGTVLSLGNITRWYRMNDQAGTTCTDAMGNGDGEYVGEVTLGTTGLIPSDPDDDAVTFNPGGSTIDHVECGAFVGDCQQLTVIAFVKPVNRTGMQFIFGHRSATTNLFQLAANNGVPRLQLRTSGTVIQELLSDFQMSVGNTYMLVAIYDNVNQDHRLYTFRAEGSSKVNVKTNTTTFSGSIDADLDTIAATNAGVSYAGGFDGVIDEVIVLVDEPPPSQSQLQALWDKSGAGASGGE